MRKTIRLIQNYFQTFLGGLARINKKGKYGFAVLIALGGGLLFLLIFVNMAVLSTQEAIKNDLPEMALYTNAVMSLMFVMLLTVTRSASPSKSTDEELLLSLPVKKSQIILAKVFYNYLFDFFTVLLTLLPSYLVYYIMVDQITIAFVVRGFFVILLLPLLSNALATFIGQFFQKIAGRFRNFSLIQSILNILFIIIFMVGYYGLNSYMYNGSIDIAQKMMSITPLYWLVSFPLDGNLLSLLWLVIFTVIPFVLGVFLRTYLLGKESQKYRSNKTDLIYEPQTPLKALFKKEWQRYFSISIYVVNTLFGGIILILVGGLLIGFGKEYIINLFHTLELPTMENQFGYLVVMIIAFGVATICTTSCSISLEGKYFWILKVHPVKPRDIFLSKIFVNVSVAAIPLLIASILCSIVIGWAYLPFLIIIGLLVSLVTAINGLTINLIYPKMEWESETVPVKQGISTLLGMGSGVLLTVVPFSLYWIGGIQNVISPLIFLSLLIVVFTGIAWLSYMVLIKKGTKHFLEI